MFWALNWGKSAIKKWIENKLNFHYIQIKEYNLDVKKSPTHYSFHDIIFTISHSTIYFHSLSAFYCTAIWYTVVVLCKLYSQLWKFRRRWLWSNHKKRIFFYDRWKIPFIFFILFYNQKLRNDLNNFVCVSCCEKSKYIWDFQTTQFSITVYHFPSHQINKHTILFYELPYW